MAELAARLIILALAGAASYFLGAPTPEMTWKVASLAASYGLLAWMLDRRKLMNAGIAGFFAVADAAAIAALLGSAGVLDHLGFLVLAPCAYAAARYGSLPTGMAPIAASALYASWSLLMHRPPTMWLYAQAAGVLTVGLLLNHRRIVVTVTRDVVGKTEPLEGPEPDGYLQLRESFRKLKDLYTDMERRSRRDRLVARLLETRFPGGDSHSQRLAETLRSLLDAEGAAIYLAADFEPVMVERGASGTTSEHLKDAAIPYAVREGQRTVADALDQALLALLPLEARSSLFQLPLEHTGRVLGMICVRPKSGDSLDECRNTLREILPVVGKLVAEEKERSGRERRLRETEVLYDTALVTQGAETRSSLAARVIRELGEIIETDHLGVYWLDGDDAIPSASTGERVRVLDAMSFAYGPGIAGWKKIGSPELVVFRSSDDARCEQHELLKRRVGSFCLIPIRLGESAEGFLLATTHRSGGLGRLDAETLRLVAAEMSRALAEIEGMGSDGLVTPAELHSMAKAGGTLVYLEPMKRDLMIENFGRAGFDSAIRQYARRVRGLLPAGGAVCRRPQGDIVALLRGVSDSYASNWANEAAATGSLVAVTSSDGVRKAPLAIRARAATLEDRTAV